MYASFELPVVITLKFKVVVFEELESSQHWDIFNQQGWQFILATFLSQDMKN